MSQPDYTGQRRGDLMQRGGAGPAQLADVLERVLDKGIVVAGDIQINLLDIELLTVKIRLLIASADKAKEMGIDWWRGDPFLSRGAEDDGDRSLEDRLRALEAKAGIGGESKQEGSRRRRKGE